MVLFLKLKIILPSIFIIFVCATFLTSCVSVKNATTADEITELNPNDFSDLVGVYFNVCFGDYSNYENTSLWSILGEEKGKYHNWYDLTVKITKHSVKNKFMAELKDGDKVMATKILKGKFENGFFNLKIQHKFDFGFLYILTSVYDNTAVKLGITKNKDLLIFNKIGSLIFFTLIPIAVDKTKTFEMKYQRINNS